MSARIAFGAIAAMDYRDPRPDELQPGTRVVQARASVDPRDARTLGAVATLGGYSRIRGYAHLVDVDLGTLAAEHHPLATRLGLLAHPEDLDPHTPPTGPTP